MEAETEQYLKTYVRSNEGERFTHHERVNEKVIVLEGIESWRGIDSVLAVLAQLHRCHHSADSTENQVIENLHFRFSELRQREMDF